MGNQNRKRYLIFERDDEYQIWRHKDTIATWFRGSETPIIEELEGYGSFKFTKAEREQMRAEVLVKERHAKDLVRLMERKRYKTLRLRQNEVEKYLFLKEFDKL